MKQDGNFQNVMVPQPLAIHYNQYMNGVDRSDQMLACPNVSQKCYTWWKILFFHLIDTEIVNGFLLFQQYRSQNPDVEALQCSNRYNISNFREALVNKFVVGPSMKAPQYMCQQVPVALSLKQPTYHIVAWASKLLRFLSLGS